jgi:hypothetical protein
MIYPYHHVVHFLVVVMKQMSRPLYITAKLILMIEFVLVMALISK